MNGKITTKFPTIREELDAAKPVYEFFDGWQRDISGCRRTEELPKQAYDYVRYIEREIGVPIKYVSVGPEREQYIKMF